MNATKKRQSENQITKDDVSDNDDNDDNDDVNVGTWTPASAEVLATRRIVKIKQSSSSSSSSSNDNGVKQNPFGSLSFNFNTNTAATFNFIPPKPIETNNTDVKRDANTTDVKHDTNTTDDVKHDTNTTYDVKHDTKNENKNDDNNKDSNNDSNTTTTAAAPVIKSFGFESYSNVNPFTAAMSAIANKTNPFATAIANANVSSNSTSSSITNVPSLKIDLKPIISKAEEKKPSSLTELTIPSPKSPKVNPFASTSPSSNPFMKIVESKEKLWDSVANEASKPATTVTSSSSISTDASNTVTTETNSADNDDGEGGDDPEEDQTKPNTIYKTYEMPENVVIETGEENEKCKLQLRAKLYRLDVKDSKNADDSSKKSGEWIEVGVGPIKILETLEDDESQRTSRIVMRREGEKKGGQGTKLLLNTLIKSYTSVTKAGDKMFRLACINAALDQTNSNTTTLSTYLIKTKFTQEADDLYDLMKAIIDRSKPSN